jgi:hypothetical protein
MNTGSHQTFREMNSKRKPFIEFKRSNCSLHFHPGKEDVTVKVIWYSLNGEFANEETFFESVAQEIVKYDGSLATIFDGKKSKAFQKVAISKLMDCLDHKSKF